MDIKYEKTLGAKKCEFYHCLWFDILFPRTNTTFTGCQYQVMPVELSSSNTNKVRLIVINLYLLLGGIDSYEPAVIVTDYDVSTIIAIESSESVVNNACVSLMLFVLQRHLMLFSEPLRSKSMVELDSSESLVSTCSSNLRQGTISLLRGWKLHTVTHKNLVILHTKILVLLK